MGFRTSEGNRNRRAWMAEVQYLSPTPHFETRADITLYFFRLAEHARAKAEKLDASWRKHELESKRAALLAEMKRNQEEMDKIDHIEHSLGDSKSDNDLTIGADMSIGSDLSSDTTIPSTDAASKSVSMKTPMSQKLSIKQVHVHSSKSLDFLAPLPVELIR
jgi:hypothetical protein